MSDLNAGRHGGYRNLLSYQKALIVHQATMYFCNKYINKNSRTRDQMIQAARSCKQNIVEGSMAARTSKRNELHLTGVARASLEELLEDYLDFMRSMGLEEWSRDHPGRTRVRDLAKGKGADYSTFQALVENADISLSVNTIMGLIHITSYLLDRQLQNLENQMKGNSRDPRDGAR